MLTASEKSGITKLTMATLNNRQIQIPFGIKFYQPETRFNSRQGSFNNVVDQVVAMRKANPALVAKHGWATDWDTVATEVDMFNAAICERMGWTNFINQPGAGVAPSPKFKALAPLAEKQLSAVADKAKKVWQGVKTLNDWIDSQLPPVETSLSQHRAEVCAACVLNGKGGLEEWFTKPAAAAIKLQMSQLASRKLSTTVDDKLNVCTACLCPLKLKVHTPLPFITEHMSDATKNELDKNCWILEEINKTVSTAVDTKPA
jgi:hypothetical protein